VAHVVNALSDPAPTVRLTAREVASGLPALAELPEAKAERGARNDWRGLPRPKAPVLGVDVTQGDPWLSEHEVLALADVIARKKAGLEFEVEGLGKIRALLYAEEAPVHAVNAILLAQAGTWNGTTWHRVVPAFVIQGGDPHGDGAGDAGYSVPDEITTHRYERGALGMPKDTKDTGGCQVFLMHCYAPHLDGRYTLFGKAVSGLDVIDKVRVGDRITSVRVVAPVEDPVRVK
jgi:peptidyl-prolyl cis-trans isomerase B (cyclophilin B)